MDDDLATTPERKDAWKHIEHTRIAFFATLSEDHRLSRPAADDATRRSRIAAVVLRRE